MMRLIEQGLEQKHNRLRKLFHEVKEMANRPSPHRLEVLHRLGKELRLLIRAEERNLYTRLEELADEETSDLVCRFKEEHRLIETLLDALEDSSLDDRIWKARFGILQDFTENSMKHEETTLLRAADSLLGRDHAFHLLKNIERDCEELK